MLAAVNENNELDGAAYEKGELPEAELDCPKVNTVDGAALEPKVVGRIDDVDDTEAELNKLVVI